VAIRRSAQLWALGGCAGVGRVRAGTSARNWSLPMEDVLTRERSPSRGEPCNPTRPPSVLRRATIPRR